MNAYISYHRKPYSKPLSIREYNKKFGQTLVDHPEFEERVHRAHKEGRKMQPDPTSHLNNRFPEHVNCKTCARVPEVVDNINLETALLVETIPVNERSHMFLFGETKEHLMRASVSNYKSIRNYINGCEDETVEMCSGKRVGLQKLVSSKELLVSQLSKEKGPYYIL